MARISIDTNVIVYAVDPSAGAKCGLARSLLRQIALADTVVTQQVIGEFLNVSRKMPHLNQRRLRRIAVGLGATLPVLSTSRDALFEAFDRAARYQLQFWDALIVTVCLNNAVEFLLSEDFQNGINIDGLVVLNPFDPITDLAAIEFKHSP